MFFRPIDIFLKSIILLVRENELKDEVVENSSQLIKSILDLTKPTTGRIFGGDNDIVENIRRLLIDIINNNSEDLDRTSIQNSLELIAGDRAPLVNTIKDMFGAELSKSGIKKSIAHTRNLLNNYYKDMNMEKHIKQASMTLNNINHETSVRDIASKLMVNLEALLTSAKTKDPGILQELDTSDDDSMLKVVSQVKEQKTGVGVFKTGWSELNDMLQGGFRSHEMVMIDALQHNYKSGMTQSIFMQLALYNDPVHHMKDPNKTPLIIYVSLEDEIKNVTEFMYRYLYHNEYNELPDIVNTPDEEIQSYIKKRLGVNGYKTKLIRVNPAEWTYRHLIDLILKLEADGYEVHACIVDYLAKLPTTGCIKDGPGGTDVRDMFNRIRNFFSSRSILFITPHQLSTEAKQLIRNGVPAADFVKEIASKGYTELSKQLDQVVDLELYIHVAYTAKKYWLTVQRGKHRIPSILDDSKKYFMLPFEKNAPLKETINNNTSNVDELANNDEEISFGL